MRPSWAALQVTMATVGHAEVHGVGPQRWVLQGSCDGRIIEESLLFHHGELIVATHTKVWCPEADNRVICDVGKLINDETRASHLLGPLVHIGRRPESFIIIVGDGMSSNFVTHSMDFLHSRVISILVRNKEGGLDVTAIGVLPLAVENLTVKVNVVVVDGIIKCDGHHLGYISTVGPSSCHLTQFPRNLSAIL